MYKTFIILIFIASGCISNKPEMPVTTLKKPDTVFVFNTDTVYLKGYIPVIEIPHPKHGRVIVNLNDSTMLLTRNQVIVVDFKTEQQMNDFLYQEFDGHLYNRK